MNWRSELKETLGSSVAFDVPLGPRVSFRIGGPADAFVKARSVEDLLCVARTARRHGVPVTVFGSGSNLLVADRGVRGIGLKLTGTLAEIEVEAGPEASARVRAGAGALNAALVARTLEASLVGLEFLATIPGSLGGALVMNAGAHGGELSSFVSSVSLLNRDLDLVDRPAAECGFTYRGSGFAPGELLVSACMTLRRGDAKEARRRIEELRALRKKTQPHDAPNAGSIFKNPPGDHAGRLIEASGLKGRAKGAARVSERHANFIVNDGGATAEDVRALAEEVRAIVLEKTGVRLEWEVRLVGDWGPSA